MRENTQKIQDSLDEIQKVSDVTYIDKLNMDKAKNSLKELKKNMAKFSVQIQKMDPADKLLLKKIGKIKR